MKYQRTSVSGFKDIEIRKSEFVATYLNSFQKVAITRCLASGFGLISTGLALGFSRLDGILKVAATSIGEYISRFLQARWNTQGGSNFIG